MILSITLTVFALIKYIHSFCQWGMSPITEYVVRNTITCLQELILYMGMSAIIKYDCVRYDEEVYTLIQ